MTATGDSTRKYLATGTQDKADGIRRPPSTSERLVIDLVPARHWWWETPTAFDEQVVLRIPEAVQKAGVTQAEWDEYIQPIWGEIRGNPVSLSNKAWLFGLCCCYFPVSRSVRNNTFERIFMNGFNEKVLSQKGLYAKTQKAVHGCGPSAKEVLWLAIALTPQEGVILYEEPQLFKYEPATNELIPAPEGFCCTGTTFCGVPVVI